MRCNFDKTILLNTFVNSLTYSIIYHHLIKYVKLNYVIVIYHHIFKIQLLQFQQHRENEATT